MGAVWRVPARPSAIRGLATRPSTFRWRVNRRHPGAVLLRDSGEGTSSPTARLACLTCRAEVLVPFSYKSRGACPS